MQPGITGKPIKRTFLFLFDRWSKLHVYILSFSFSEAVDRALMFETTTYINDTNIAQDLSFIQYVSFESIHGCDRLLEILKSLSRKQVPGVRDTPSRDKKQQNLCCDRLKLSRKGMPKSDCLTANVPKIHLLPLYFGNYWCLPFLSLNNSDFALLPYG